MKRKILFPLTILAMLLVPSCREEMDSPVDELEFILTATIEPDVLVRSSLGPSIDGEAAVLWSEGDRIGVYVDDASDPALFTLFSGEGDVSALFSGPVWGKKYRAIYPWRIAGKTDGTEISLILPEEQEYTPGTFASGYYPMLAEGKDNRLSFKNLCSILRVSVLGHHSVTAVEFLPNDSTIFVSGAATASLVNGIPQLSMSREGKNRIVLNTPGVVLNEEAATDFYLVLPPQTYQGGFTVRIHTSSGSMDKVYGKDFTMERSRIHKATPFVLKLDQGVEPSLGLEGRGTAEEPFLIGSLSDLLLMQMTVNTEGGMLTASDGTAVAAQTACFKLISDIDLSSVCGAASGNSWTPIGDVATNENLWFTGTFDGDGHTISNLFINREKDYQGLFGSMVKDSPRQFGTLSRLRVTGFVQGASRVGMLVGQGGLVSHCTSEGQVVSDADCAGGIAGFLYKVHHCVNLASVRKTKGMLHAIGGIAGEIAGLCHDCRNEGNIASIEGYEIGGIVGRCDVTTNIYNCTNLGTVTGGQQCGGISGVMRGTVENCFNGGEVTSGYGKCAGIVGVLDYNSSIRNCVNVGHIQDREYGTDNGGICGYVRQNGNVEYAYWPGVIAAVLEFNDPSTSICRVTPFSHWEGGETVLYTTEEGFPCTSLIDALNVWASNNRTAEKVFSGWMYDSDLQIGVLTGEPAKNPVGEDGFFVVLASSLEAGPDGGDYAVRVASSSGYNVTSAPDWIHSHTGTALEGVPNNWMQSFSVEANPGSRRTGIIVLSNGNGQSKIVSVIQYGRDEFDWSQSFYHRSLFFAFTGEIPFWGLGPYEASYQEPYLEALKTYPDRILHAALFREGDFSCPQSIPMFNKNGINGIPYLLMDNKTRISNANAATACKEILAAYQEIENRKTLTLARIQTGLSDRNVQVDINGYFKEAGNYRIQVMLLEDGLSGDGHTINDIVRVVLTPETGDPFSIPEDRSERSFTYSADVPSGYNLENMRVLVFFQVPISESVYLVDDTYVSESVYLVDNTFAVPVIPE